MRCSDNWYGRALVAFGLNQRLVATAVGDPDNFIWIQNAAQLVSLVVAPPLGKISDSAGRKQIIVVCALSCLNYSLLKAWMAQFGLVMGALGSVLTGAATSIGMAIGGSAIFGFASPSAYICKILCRLCLGLADLASKVSALVSEILPRRQRGMAQAIFNFAASIGNLVASIGGQAITSIPLIGGRPG